MSRGLHTLLTVTVDGQTKTGKGAASAAIAEALRSEGYAVYYDVAGDFYRRYVALVRQELKLTETEPLPTGKVLEQAAVAVHERRDAYDPDLDLGDLQRPAISKSVAVLAELPLAQQAGAEWWQISIENAIEQTADIFVVDGRNPRDRIRDALQDSGAAVLTALDLYMRCTPTEAARRNLLIHADHAPTDEEIEFERGNIEARRARDLERDEQPFVLPDIAVDFDVEHSTVATTLVAAWKPQPSVELPRTIVLDNTNITKDVMVSAVRALAVQSIEAAKRR